MSRQQPRRDTVEHATKHHNHRHSTSMTASPLSSRIPRPGPSYSSTPAATGSNTSASAASLRSTGPTSSSSRKRPRSTATASSSDYAYPPQHSSRPILRTAAPRASVASGIASWRPTEDDEDDGAVSPPPLANTRYTLSGGLDTPGAALDAQREAAEGGLDPFYNHDDYANDAAAWERRPRGSAASPPAQAPPVRVFTASWEAQRRALGGESNGRARVAASSPSAGSGWGAAVLGALGGAVAGVWTFCVRSAGLGEWQSFRAKRVAGGGVGTARGMAVDEAAWEDETPARPSQRSDWSLERSFDRLPTPVPGEYPRSDDEDESMVRLDGEPREDDERPAKRVQTDGGWVVVGRGRGINRGASPRFSTSSVGAGETTATLAGQANSSAARRLKRSSLHPRVSGVSFAGSPAAPAVQANRRRTIEVARLEVQLPRSSPVLGMNSLKTSPPSVEVKKFAARLKREEKAADERFQRLNDRLNQMIKQGREALGSTVEVVEDVDMW